MHNVERRRKKKKEEGDSEEEDPPPQKKADRSILILFPRNKKNTTSFSLTFVRVNAHAIRVHVCVCVCVCGDSKEAAMVYFLFFGFFQNSPRRYRRNSIALTRAKNKGSSLATHDAATTTGSVGCERLPPARLPPSSTSSPSVLSDRLAAFLRCRANCDGASTAAADVNVESSSPSSSVGSSSTLDA